MDKDKNESKEKEIDLLELGHVLWSKRKFILKTSILGLVFGAIIAFSIPKQYMTTVTLAPESQGNSSISGNMGALAAVAGINLSNSNTETFLSPDIYPKLMESTPFILGLFDIPVKDLKSNIDTTLYSYLAHDQKQAWWSYILALPSKVLDLFKSNDSDNIIGKESNEEIMILTNQQVSVIANLKNRLNINVDKKTNIISLSSTMQSPVISAYIADTVITYLQDYVIKYRTRKARQDLQFTEKLYKDAKTDYYSKQQEYAKYTDENQGVISARFATSQERLQNEMNLAYSVYNQAAQQLQLARIKIQDTTPVYTVIQPAIEPLVPISPNKKLVIIGFVLLFIFGTCGWILGKYFFSKKQSY